MPVWERVANAWKSYVNGAERVGNSWKTILLGHEWTGSAWKLIYAALSGVRNLAVTRTTDIITTPASILYGVWSSDSREYSGSTLATARARAVADLVTVTPNINNRNGGQYRNIRFTGSRRETNPTQYWARYTFEYRSATYTPSTSRSVTTYSANWEAPEFGTPNQYRMQRQRSTEIVVTGTSYSLGSSRIQIRVRAENTDLGIEGPWSAWV